MTAVDGLTTDAWLANVLRGDATLKAACPGGIWQDQRGQGEPLVFPFLVWTAMSPGVDVMVVGDQTIALNQTYLLQAIDQSRSYALCRTILNRVYALLHGKGGLIANYGRVLSCVRVDSFRRAEVDEGQEYRYLGAYYRVMVSGS